MPIEIAVDANILMSALLGGQAGEILFDQRFTFITSERIIWEVKRYLPRLVSLSGVKEEVILRALEMLPIRVVSDSDYEDAIPQARRLIEKRDPKDVDILALALKRKIPLWTQDKDFDDISEVEIIRTYQLL